jgi:hypothetical protein
MANLRRHIAPIDHSVWAFIDNEARRILNTKLTGRKVVDFVGPKGELLFRNDMCCRSLRLRFLLNLIRMKLILS